MVVPVTWVEAEPVVYSHGRLDVKSTHEGRFSLYRIPSKTRSTNNMWNLYDASTKTFRFLYGEGWAAAEAAAANRIEELMSEASQ